MAYKNMDDLLDGLWDHIFGDTDEDDITEEDEETFEHLAKFFEQFEDSGRSSGRRRTRQSSGRNRVARPKRGSGRSRSNSGSYGASLFFGKGKD